MSNETSDSLQFCYHSSVPTIRERKRQGEEKKTFYIPIPLTLTSARVLLYILPAVNHLTPTGRNRSRQQEITLQKHAALTNRSVTSRSFLFQRSLLVRTAATSRLHLQWRKGGGGGGRGEHVWLLEKIVWLFLKRHSNGVFTLQGPAWVETWVLRVCI